MPSLLIRSGTVITMNDRFDVVEGDVSIRDGRIAAIGRDRVNVPRIMASHGCRLERTCDGAGRHHGLS